MAVDPAEFSRILRELSEAARLYKRPKRQTKTGRSIKDMVETPMPKKRDTRTMLDEPKKG